jgi:outer membrane protein TolC
MTGPLANFSLLLLFLLIGPIKIPVNAQSKTEMGDEISYAQLERLVETAKANYPNTKAFNARIQIAEKGIQRTRLSYFDVLSFSYFFTPTNAVAALNPNMLNGYQFGLFANIGAILQKPTQVRQAKEELKVATHEKEVYILNLEAEVKKRYFEYAKTKAVFRVVSQAYLDAQSRVEDIRNRFERGEIQFENYNNALLDLSNRLQAKINFEGDILIAKANLEELLGTQLEEIK